MDAPPPQYIPPYNQVPPKKNNTLWIVLGICCLSACACCPISAAILFPVFAQAREAAKSTMCMSNLKQLSLSVQMYANDWDDKFPRSKTWEDSIQKYAPKDEKVFHCPSVRDLAGFGYGMNDAYSQKALADIKELDKAIVLFDSADLGWNAHSPEPNYPVPPRHHQGNNVGYADSHVKHVKN